MEIKVNNVSYVYNEGMPFEKLAVSDLNLEIENEKITGIIGNSGSGKTTLVEMFNALILPTEGNIKIGEFNLKRDAKYSNINELRHKVGLVAQFPEEQFFNPLVYDEVAFALINFSTNHDNIHKKVSEALKIVGLDDTYLNRNVFNLSSGEQRKVAIASIMIFNPKVLILDEPTVGLDAKSKKKLITLIKKLKTLYKKTIIIISHDVDMLNAMADNIVVMEKGKILLSGKTDEVFKNTSVFKNHNLRLPKILEFINEARIERAVILNKTSDIKELIKDVYRHV